MNELLYIRLINVVKEVSIDNSKENTLNAFYANVKIDALLELLEKAREPKNANIMELKELVEHIVK